MVDLKQFEGTPRGPNNNSGHGWVWPTPSGVVARCGGPGLCSECKADQDAELERRRAALKDLMILHYGSESEKEALNARSALSADTQKEET